MSAALLASAAAFGAVIGSFLNVVIYRVPAGLSVVRPGSACPRCSAPIRPRDNVPVVSWLILRGRCRDCRAPISPRYPAVEALTAALFAGVVAHFDTTTSNGWVVPAFWVLTAAAAALSVIDLDTRRLPDPIVLTGSVVGAVLLVAASLLGAGDGTSALVRAGIGAVAVTAFHFVAMLVYPAGMGFGDVKTSFLTGMFLAWLGWGPLLVGVFASYVVGLVAAGVLAGRGRRTRAVPFGPAMFAGALIGLLAGQPLWSTYLQVMGA